MKHLALLIAIGMVASAMAQTHLVPVRFRIRHADPWAVKALMEGVPLVSPEMSTLPGFAGLGAIGAGAMNRLFADGTLMVNPTDNSLWWIPPRR